MRIHVDPTAFYTHIPGVNGAVASSSLTRISTRGCLDVAASSGVRGRPELDQDDADPGPVATHWYLPTRIHANRLSL